MSARKPSLKTQLKNANVLIAEHISHCAKLQKDYDTAKTNQEYALKRAAESEAELAQINAFLDALPAPPADKMADGYTRIKTMTRLMVWLANK